ncbi:MAG: hypothetical protein ACRC8W_01065 [Plesiomonas shigelloides]
MNNERQIKFYMNNPCEIIRKISDDFSEVKVYPKFVDEEMSGSNWCSACMVGGYDGSHPTHTCEPYQDVIDYINDTESSMIVVVENRLLNNDPVEFKAWSKLRNQINEMSDTRNKLYSEIREKESIIKSRSQLLCDVNEEIFDAKNSVEVESKKLDSIKQEIYESQKKLSQIDGSVKIGGLSVSLSIGHVMNLIRSKIILDSLNAGGVDNWEWYYESMPEEDIDDLVQIQIEQIRLSGVQK